MSTIPSVQTDSFSTIPLQGTLSTAPSTPAPIDNNASAGHHATASLSEQRPLRSALRGARLQQLSRPGSDTNFSNINTPGSNNTSLSRRSAVQIVQGSQGQYFVPANSSNTPLGNVTHARFTFEQPQSSASQTNTTAAAAPVTQPSAALSSTSVGSANAGDSKAVDVILNVSTPSDPHSAALSLGLTSTASSAAPTSNVVLLSVPPDAGRRTTLSRNRSPSPNPIDQAPGVRRGTLVQGHSSSWAETEGRWVKIARGIESSKACRNIPGKLGGAIVRFVGKTGELAPIASGGTLSFGLMLVNGGLTIVTSPGAYFCEGGRNLTARLGQNTLDTGLLFVTSVERFGLTCISPLAFFGCTADFVERHDKAALKRIEDLSHSTEESPLSCCDIMQLPELRVVAWLSAGMPLPLAPKKPQAHMMKATVSAASRDPVLSKARDWEEEGGCCWPIAGCVTKTAWKVLTIPKKTVYAGCAGAVSLGTAVCAIPYAIAGGVSRCFSKVFQTCNSPTNCNTCCWETLSSLEEGLDSCGKGCCQEAAECCKIASLEGRTCCIATAGLVERVTCDPLSCIASCFCQNCCPKSSCAKGYTNCTESLGKRWFRYFRSWIPARRQPGTMDTFCHTPIAECIQDGADLKEFSHRVRIHEPTTQKSMDARRSLTAAQRKELQRAVQPHLQGKS